MDNFHHQCFEVVKKMADMVGTDVALPRICGRQRHHDNVEATTPLIYYRRVITIPMLDHILMELDSRFKAHQTTALKGLILVPSLMLFHNLDESIVQMRELIMLYQKDLPDPENALNEYDMWKTKWEIQRESIG